VAQGRLICAADGL